MAIICPECGREFMGQRDTCPVCKCATVEEESGRSEPRASRSSQQIQPRNTVNNRNYQSRSNANSALIRCPDCGRQISSKATACPGCGHPFERTKFCKFCGSTIAVDSVVCTKCGRQVENIGGSEKGIVINNNNNNNVAAVSGNGMYGLVSPKSRLVDLILCFFLGIFGVHRFYVGKVGTGILMIFLMCTGFGEIWLIIDFFIILFGGFTDNFGRRVINW